MTTLDRLRCAACGATWLTPAGERLVQSLEPCLHCGGALLPEQDARDNLSIVRRAWDALLSGDIDGFLEHNHPNARLRPVGVHISDQIKPVYVGHAGLRRWAERCVQACDVVPRELRSFGEHVVTLGSQRRRGTEGKPHSVAWVFRLRDEKILSLEGYLDQAEALRLLAPDASQ